MKTLLLALAAASLAGPLAAQQPARDQRPDTPARASAADASPGFDWMLGGVGVTMVIGAFSLRPRRLTKVSA